MALSPELQAIAKKVSNWGRWGVDDRRGTLNLIDNAAVLRGVAAARQGKVFSLAIPFDEHGPMNDRTPPGRDNPKRRMLSINMNYTGDPGDSSFSDDAVEMGLQAATQWDALAHCSYDGLLYNGVAASTVDDAGAHELGIDVYGPIATRGILLDVARALGVDHFDDNHAITGDELDLAQTRAGVSVEPGDVICVRTGQGVYLGIDDPYRFADPSPGIGPNAIEWLRDHDVAGCATDCLTFEPWPKDDGTYAFPVHAINLRDIGLPQGQLWALDELALDCIDDGQYDFLLVATPIPFTRAVGAPVAPTAIK
jgi:kynurenine formamidase